jgi:DNA-binding XRE family transcriptional regulator
VVSNTSLRQVRTGAGLTQGELAARSGVSRQLIGAVESGRHLPRVDAALAMATALGVDVADLFPTRSEAVDVVTGSAPAVGTMVRFGRVGDTMVTRPLRSGRDGWGVADGIMDQGNIRVFDVSGPGMVIVGCEPGLEILETMLRQEGAGALAVAASSRSAVEALSAGRAHAAIVHGSGESPPISGVERFRFATWRVGLSAPPEPAQDWFQRLLDGPAAIVQRETGAAAQEALLDAIPHLVPSGPVAGSHLEAVQIGIHTGMAALTIEPVAVAAGLEFRPLETHRVDLLVDPRWRHDPAVSSAMSVMGSSRFLGRLRAFGGYDLSEHGTKVA